VQRPLKFKIRCTKVGLEVDPVLFGPDPDPNFEHGIGANLNFSNRLLNFAKSRAKADLSF
jgi:hypothetical protein